MFNRKCSLIGVVHLQPMPGAAGYAGSLDKIMSFALDQALTYKEHGFDALIIENTHDLPFRTGYVDPETTAAMAVMAASIKYETQMPVGVQVLAGANLEALGIAIASSLDFIRVEGYVFAHIGDEGFHESCAAELIRRRWQLKAEKIKIFADIKKKHSSHAITADLSLIETAHAAEFFKADGVVISGTRTGDAPNTKDVEDVRKAVKAFVLVGSGVNVDNVKHFVKHTDALIVSSSLRQNSDWRNALDLERVKQFTERFNSP